jgi:hypothetical protein
MTASIGPSPPGILSPLLTSPLPHYWTTLVLSVRITSSRRSTGVGRLAGDQGRFPQICWSGPNPSRLETNSELTLQKLSSVTPRSRIISIRSGISSPGRFISRDARLHWRSCAHLPPRASLASGRVVQCVDESRYFDDAGVLLIGAHVQIGEIRLVHRTRSSMEARTTSPVWATCSRMRSPARRASRLSSAARISACSCTDSLQRDSERIA